MNSTNGIKRIIWAVDAFAESKQSQIKTLRALKYLSHGSDIPIEPVCVLSPDQLRIPISAFQSSRRQYRMEAETNLTEWISEARVPNVKPPTFLVQDYFSGRSSVKALLAYAEQTHTSVIGVSTHTKKAWQKFLVGSFVETLLLKSEIPILVVNPRLPVSASLKKILFPTDFTIASLTAFKKVFALAKLHNAKIFLYYKLEYLLPQTVDMVFASPDYTTFLKEDLVRIRKKAEEWKEMGKRQGVKVEVWIDEKPGFIADAILQAQRKANAQMIGMASHSGRLAVALMGSVARQVVRLSSCPVWVIHPHEASSSRQRQRHRKQEVVLI